MAEAQTVLTGADLLNLPMGMGERFELVEGKLVTMPLTGYPHGVVVATITILVGRHVRDQRSGRMCGAETGFYTRGDDKTVRAPDVAFISYQKLPAGSLPEGFLNIAPDLVVEVVSPGDPAGEIEQKTQEWLDFGVPLVWIVYPESQRVQVHTGDQSRTLKASDRIEGGTVIPGFEALVGAFFQD